MKNVHYLCLVSTSELKAQHWRKWVIFPSQPTGSKNLSYSFFHLTPTFIRVKALNGAGTSNKTAIMRRSHPHPRKNTRHLATIPIQQKYAIPMINTGMSCISTAVTTRYSKKPLWGTRAVILVSSHKTDTNT